MVSPDEEGIKIYDLMWKIHDLEEGAAVAGVMGGQGSVKTACCLDLAEKKMDRHNDEKIFWYETMGTPAQFRKLRKYPFEIFVEDGLNIEVLNITDKQVIDPDIFRFNNLKELYENADVRTLNVVYFNNIKRWYDFIKFLQKDVTSAIDWQTVFFDEMESIFPASTDNLTEDQWWTWMKDFGLLVMECRKCRVGFIGNYHYHGTVDHRIHGKFMFHLYGFGAIVGKGRIKQNAVDMLQPGEFWIDRQRSRFGKISIENQYIPPDERWIVNKI